MATNTNSDFKVVDASIILAELLPDEENTPEVHKHFEEFLENKISFIAPPILKYEVANSFRSQFLQKRLTPEKSEKILKKFLFWPIVYKEINFTDAFKLAVKENLSVYDASYLYLAKSNGWPLLTLDKNLSTL